MSTDLFERHKGILELASSAVAIRGTFSAYAHNPQDYNELLAAEGQRALEGYRDSLFYLDQPSSNERIGEEVSPYGIALGVKYPKSNLDNVMLAATRAQEAWCKVGLEARTGVCLEILHQLHARTFEIAFATMYTTGAPFAMAFRYGGPYALERGLEAVALAYQEMRCVPGLVKWEWQDGEKSDCLTKTFQVVGLGIGLVIGCSTQPNWSAYPGLFANLMTGNAVVVKPHPLAILPLAITVGVVRRVLRDWGHDPNLVMLVVDELNRPLAGDLALRPEVGLIDFTGNSEFADWLAENARQARVHRFGGSVNPVVIDSTDHLDGMMSNLALSVTQFSGRMCTAPRVIFTPREGIGSATGMLDRDAFESCLTQHLERLFADPARAALVLGAIRCGEYEHRIDAAAEEGAVVLSSRRIAIPDRAGGYMLTPLVVRVSPDQFDVYARERFGPILFLVECETTADCIAQAVRLARVGRALIAAVYSVDAGVRVVAQEAFSRTGSTLCVNFTGDADMNHSASFSDFHGSGVMDGGGSVVTNSDFVVGRFRVVALRERMNSAARGSVNQQGGNHE